MNKDRLQSGVSIPTQSDIGAVVYRGETRENVHFASVAVVDGSGSLTHYLGDPYRLIATRSSVKPFQALPLLTKGVAESLQLTQQELAVVCASHNGTDGHREAVRSVFRKAGLEPGLLQCGSHWPLGRKLMREYPTPEEEADSLRHNCSGKHAGFLALAKHLGGDLSKYLDPNSKTQTIVRESVGNYCEFPPEELGVAIDGCSAPVFTMPLVNLAMGFRKLAAGEGSDETEMRAAAIIRDAMYAHPEMISGERRFDLDLARSFPDNLVCKVGAEAIEGIGFRERSIGIAVKVHDGADQVCPVICVEVLRQLGIIGGAEVSAALEQWAKPAVKNYRGMVTGHILPEFTLRTV